MTNCPACGVPNPRRAALTASPAAAPGPPPPPPPDDGPAPSTVAADDLAVRIDAFRAAHKDGAVVVVFGSSSAGKTFLNLRVKDLNAAQVEQTDDGAAGFLVPATDPKRFTTAKFELRLSAKQRDLWPILVIDLPGELFGRVEFHERSLLAIEAAECVVLYIHAADICGSHAGRAEAWAGAKEIVGQYTKLLDVLIASRHDHETVPVYIALSRADELGNLDEAGRRGAWFFLREHARSLCERVSDRFLFFGCGFVASHVHAETVPGTLRFMAGPNKLVPSESEARDLLDEPFRQYVVECLRNHHRSAGKIKSTPGEACCEPERTVAQHQEDARRFQERGVAEENVRHIERLLGIGEGSVELVPAYDNRLKSKGVRDLQRALRDLYAASRAHRRRVAGAAVPEFVRAMERNPEYRLGLRGLWDRALVRVFQRFPRAGAAGVLAFCALGVAAAVYWSKWEAPPLAERAADEHNRSIDVQVGALRNLPPNFAIDPAEAWRVSDDELRVLLARASRDRLNFGIHDDVLVRRPASDLHVFGAGIQNAPELRRVYASLGACPSPDRSCQQLAGNFPRPEGAAPAGLERHMHYVRALHRYVVGRHPPAAAEVEADLARFEEGRLRLFGETPTLLLDQRVLPDLARRLILAHVQLRAGVAGASLPRYAEAVDTALLAALERDRKLTARDIARIGVDPNRLAMHIIAANVISYDEPERLRKQLVERLGRAQLAFGDGRPVLTDEARRVWETYPVLSCFAMVVLFPPPQQALAAQQQAWCSRLEPTAVQEGLATLHSDLLERADLASGVYWSNDQRAPISFHRFMPALAKAARKFADKATTAREKADLEALASLKETSWRRELFGFTGLTAGLAGCALAALAFIYTAVRVLRLRWAARMLVKPLRED